MMNAMGGVDVFHNPDLHVPDDPSWFAWAEQVQKDKAAVIDILFGCRTQGVL